MTQATATFLDCYCGAVPMVLVPVKATRRGEKVVLYSWKAASSSAVTGHTVFSSVERAIGVALKDRRFSNVEVAA